MQKSHIILHNRRLQITPISIIYPPRVLQKIS